MPFHLHVGLHCATDNTTHQVDLCQFLRGESLSHCPLVVTSPFVFFDREKFPPPPPGGDPKLAFDPLMKALRASSLEAGFELVKNGAPQKATILSSRKLVPFGSDPPIACFRVGCKHFFHKKKFVDRKTHPVGATMAHRETTLHNNKKGSSRGADGKFGPRKAVSNKATKNQCTCTFAFTIFLNKHGFHLKKSKFPSGATHCNHMKRQPKDVPQRLRNLTDKIQKRMGELGNSFTGPAAGRNFLLPMKTLFSQPTNSAMGCGSSSQEG